MYGGGCTSSTAINYNSMTTVDDGSCVEPVYGCTLPGASIYTGVASDTPGFEGLLVGSARDGLLAWPAARAALNFEPRANVLRGCILAVEGCMDSRALNYDPDATVDSNDWCVLPKRGCMLPLAAAASAVTTTRRAANAQGGAASPRSQPPASVSQRSGAEPLASRDGDGLSINFDPSATVHDASMCVLERRGCMSSTALNFDVHATLPDVCYEPAPGCLDLRATNFNCSASDESSGAHGSLDVLAFGQLVAAADGSGANSSNANSSALTPAQCRVALPPPASGQQPHRAANSTSASDATVLRAVPRATVHMAQLCAYPPPPPYALYVGVGVSALAALGLVGIYLRRRSAKVDAATALVVAHSCCKKVSTRGVVPLSHATVRALAATAAAVPDQQAANTCREVVKLRRKLLAASEAAGAAGRLASEAASLQSTASALTRQVANLEEGRADVEAELNVVGKRFQRLLAAHDGARLEHHAAAHGSAVAISALAATLGAVEAELALAQQDAADQRASAAVAAAATTAAAAAASAEEASMRAGLAEADDALGACRAAYVETEAARRRHLDEKEAAQIGLRCMAVAVAGCEEETASAVREVRTAVEAAASRKVDAIMASGACELSAAEGALRTLAEAREQLLAQVEVLKGAAAAEQASHAEEVAALQRRVFSLDEQAGRLRDEQRDAEEAAAAAVAALKADKEAVAEQLGAQLKHLETEREKEAAELKGKVEKMKTLQQAALAAGSVRGRQMLYAENLKAKRAALALTDSTNAGTASPKPAPPAPVN